MSQLIEKWKNVLTYVSKTDGLTVPENKWQECAEWLEKAEQRENGFKDSLATIHQTYREGYTFGGWGDEAVAELLDYYEKKQFSINNNI
jgi:hypothetical protein